MPITLTISITEPDIVTGDARNDLLNSVTKIIEVLGPGWTHVVTHTGTGTIEFRFLRREEKPS